MPPIFVFLFSLLTFISCSEDKYTRSDMWKMGQKADPKLELVIPEDITKGVKCADYGTGCLGGVTVKVKMVKMICVEFETAKQAKDEAARINGYYIKNWVFDDVTGEPVLEKFVTEAYQAKKANL